VTLSLTTSSEFAAGRCRRVWFLVSNYSAWDGKQQPKAQQVPVYVAWIVWIRCIR
jgi:hypothetical protein